MTTRELDRTADAEAGIRELLADAALAALLASDGPRGFLLESVEAEPRRNPLSPDRDHVVIMATIVLPPAREGWPASEFLGWLHTEVADRAAMTNGVTLTSWIVDNAGGGGQDVRPRAIAVFTA